MAALSTFTGAVLAGGGSSRLGRDKALLDLGEGPLVAVAARKLGALFPRVVVVGRPERLQGLGLEAIADAVEGGGPLAGVLTACRAARTEWVFAVACDMPRLDAAVVRAVCARAGESDRAVAPRVGGELEPLCAAYRARAAGDAAERLHREGRLSLRGLLEALGVRALEEAELRAIDPALRAFENVNTEADLRRASG